MGVKVAFQDSGVTEPDAGGSAVGLAVPEAAVRREQGRDYVYRVRDGLAERRAVAVGGARNGDVLVQSGLMPGDTVITEAPPELIDGAAVKEKSP
jgi:membrane fusion protein (multidrug efflux system)